MKAMAAAKNSSNSAVCASSAFATGGWPRGGCTGASETCAGGGGADARASSTDGFAVPYDGGGDGDGSTVAAPTLVVDARLDPPSLLLPPPPPTPLSLPSGCSTMQAQSDRVHDGRHCAYLWVGCVW